MSHMLTSDQLDSLAKAAAFLLRSDHPNVGVLTLVGIAENEQVVSSVFIDRPAEALNLSVVYTFLESIVKLAEVADSCPCEPCRNYQAKLDLIRQIINPN